MNNLIQQIQLQLDESQGPVFWTYPQLYDAANAAQITVWANLKDWQKISVPITTTASQTYYDISTLTTLMIPQFIIYKGVKVYITDHALLQDWANNWKNEQPSRPNWVVLWDYKTLLWFPPANDAYAMQLWGVPWPTEIADGTHSLIGIDPLVVNAVALRASASLLEETQPLLADAKELEALEFEKRYARQMRRMLGDNIARLRPVTAWDLAEQGDIKVGRLFFGNQD